MKKVLCLLAASLVSLSTLSAELTRKNCQCVNCTCTPENHCGCLSEDGCPCTPDCNCGDNCACNPNPSE